MHAHTRTVSKYSTSNCQKFIKKTDAHLEIKNLCNNDSGVDFHVCPENFQ